MTVWQWVLMVVVQLIVVAVAFARGYQAGRNRK